MNVRKTEQTDREITLGGGDPKVGAAGVEDDGEVLRRRADADLPEVPGVHEVLEGDDVEVVGVVLDAVVMEAEVVLRHPSRRPQGVEVELLLPQADPRRAAAGSPL